METEHFIMLDVTNTVSENEIVNGSADVQIVFPPNKNSSLDINAIKSRIESNSKPKEERKHLFTIILNQDAGYKAQQFR